MALTPSSESPNESPAVDEPQETPYSSDEREVQTLGDIASGGLEQLTIQTHRSPRRTRSQTGSTAKRRLPEEHLPPPPHKTSASRKKPRPASSKKSSSPADTEWKEGIRTESSLIDFKDASQPTTRSSSPFSSTPPLTFLESSASPGYAPERRGPRSRATLPIPVPNLIKKSRGRRVPTQESAEVQADPKEKRMYVCTVEGCGKCFHRGEHLKRHIRSIHTHEKPFKCTHPSCGKFFNRHDNLLQHLKVHKQNHNHNEENGNPQPILKLSPASLSLSPEPEPDMEHEADSSVSDSEISETPLSVSVKPTASLAHPIIYDSYVSSPRFDAACDSFTTNMAISSLRTEIAPHSPPTSRVRDSL